MNAVTTSLVDQVAERAKCLSPQDKRDLVDELVRRLGVSLSIESAVSGGGDGYARSKWARLVDGIEQDPLINSPRFQAGLKDFKAAVREAHESILG